MTVLFNHIFLIEITGSVLPYKFHLFIQSSFLPALLHTVTSSCFPIFHCAVHYSSLYCTGFLRVKLRREWGCLPSVRALSGRNILPRLPAILSYRQHLTHSSAAPQARLWKRERNKADIERNLTAFAITSAPSRHIMTNTAELFISYIVILPRSHYLFSFP